MNVLIGTSGWHYADWNGRFYPPNVKAADQLSYYAQHFNAIEINSPFYHPPRLATVQHWVESVSADFRFAIKLHRFVTHTKYLKMDDECTQALQGFFDLLVPLGEQLATVLVQLPPSFTVDNERLQALAEQTQAAQSRLGLTLPLAVEFRHASWFNDETFKLMHRYQIANVISDTPRRWPMSYAVTAGRVYIRLHGNRRLYSSSYTKAELMDWCAFIQAQGAHNRQVLCFFDNTSKAVAPGNAETLLHLMTTGTGTNKPRF